MLEDPQSLVTEINGCISQASKRQQGLLKLSSFLENCQFYEEIILLEKSSSFWIKTLLQIFENHPISIHAKLAHYCFYLLIQCSKNASPELSRTISTNFVEKSVTILTQSSDQLAKNALICLNELITHYRGACSQHKTKIELFVLSQIDSNSNEVAEWASRCYSKLPYLHKNQANTDMWYAYFKNMIKNANIILNDIFEEYQPVVSINTEENESELLKSQTGLEAETSLNIFISKSEKIFKKKDKDDLETYYQKLEKRFRACCLSLGYMFEPMNEEVVIKIRSGEIIEFQKRLFFFDLKKLTSSLANMESKYLIEIMAELYNHMFRFSIKFFQILQTNLLTKGNKISHMLANFAPNLKEKFLFSSISSYYECLSEWIYNVGPNSGFNKYSSAIIENLLINIKPIKKNVLTIEAQKYTKNKNSKTFYNQNDSRMFFSDKSIVNTHQLKLRKEIICSALNCLSHFIRNFSYKLNYNQYDKVQQTISDILLCIQNDSTLQKPYDLAECRLSLYKILFELCHAQNNKLSPPLSISICLFQTALQDSSNEIKLFAQSSLNTLRSYSYPIMPIYIKEYNIQTSRSKEEIGQNHESTNAIHTLTNRIPFNNNQTVVQNIVPSNQTNLKMNSENLSVVNADLAATNYTNNTSSTKTITSLINNSLVTNNNLVDMKNALNIQGSKEGSTLKRKSPISEEELLVKNDLSKKPFINRLNGSYNSKSNLKENGDGDSNGLNEDDSEIECIDDSEMDDEHDELDDDEEADSYHEDYDENEDIHDEDLDENMEEDQNFNESSSAEAINEKYMNRSGTCQSSSQSQSLNGQSQSNEADMSKTDFKNLLKETGDYSDESDENSDSDEVCQIGDDEDDVSDIPDEKDSKKSESQLSKEASELKSTACLVADSTLNATNESLVSQIEKTSEVLINDHSENKVVVDGNLIAQVVAQEKELMGNSQDLQPVEQTSVVMNEVRSSEKTEEKESIILEESIIISNELDTTVTNENNKNNSSIVADYGDENSQKEIIDEAEKIDKISSSPQDITKAAELEMDLEKACADFKVDALIVNTQESAKN